MIKVNYCFTIAETQARLNNFLDRDLTSTPTSPASCNSITRHKQIYREAHNALHISETQLYYSERKRHDKLQAFPLPKARVGQQPQHADGRCLPGRRFGQSSLVHQMLLKPPSDFPLLVFSRILLLYRCLYLLPLVQKWFKCPHQIRRLDTGHLLSARDARYQFYRKDAFERR